MKVIRVQNADSFARPKEPSYNKKLVKSIIDQVKKDGDAALRRFEARFNDVSLKALQVSKKEIRDAYKSVTKEQLAAIETAKYNLTRTESALKKQLKSIKINSNGTKIEKSFSALDSVGCYVPGGLARYPSSAVMSIVPAKVAGVEKIIVVTPPNKQGLVDPLVLVAADMCGADLIFKAGGAHAIAALAYGTKSIPYVDKIVGPGGAFVTAAKYLVSNVTSIDMLAGPTELTIIADNSADPELVALDLISQSEHSPDTVCCLVTTSKKLADSVNVMISSKAKNMPRKEIVLSSLNKNGLVALCDNMSDAITIANKLAPEHLEVMTRQPQKLARQIRTAGLVLIGKNTPSAASDYLLGTNHILPTNRFGKSRGSLSVLDFVKVQTVVESSRGSLEKINKKLKTLTESENLPNHYLAVRKRL